MRARARGAASTAPLFAFVAVLALGAVIAALSGKQRSPEAQLAAAAFAHFRDGLSQALRESVSGKELIERGYALDVDVAAELNVSDSIPRLVDRAFIRMDRR